MADTPLSAADYQSLILDELGQSSSSALANRIDLLWRRWRGKGAVSVDLQYLYVKLQAVRFLLGPLANQRKWTAGGVTQDDSAPFEQWFKLKEDLEAEIKAAEMILAAQRGGGAIGQLTQVTPVQVDAGRLDPNSRALRGDPLERWPGRRCP